MIEKDVSLATLSTFRMGGTAKEVITLTNNEEIQSFFVAHDSWFVIGSGSNIVFPDGVVNTPLVRLAPRGIEILREEGNTVYIQVGAGDIWDDVVAYAVEKGLSGVEALSAIPGTAGATPVQNVGAYGVEISDVLEFVYVFDTEDKQFKELTADECGFMYRDSIFKSGQKGRYVIVSLVLRLSKDKPTIPNYPGVKETLSENPTLKEIRGAITTIRWKKLPDPKEVASVGSFFKNPIISKDKAEEIYKKYPSIVIYPVSETHTKVGAGSLIDTVGWKGKDFGHISTYKNNALVLVHDGEGNQEDLLRVISEIKLKIQDFYGILLETEPEILDKLD